MATITGTGGSEVLTGTSADDTLLGLGGNDDLDGGGGNDTAQFSEVLQNYRFGRASSRLVVEQVVFTALNDGNDTLRRIETLRFADRDIAVLDEYRLNTSAVEDQYRPSSAGLDNGNHVLVWRSDTAEGNGGIRAQLIGSDGGALGAVFGVNLQADGDQFDPSVTALAGGSFLVAWTSNAQDGSLGGVYARIVDAAGVPQGPEIAINDFTTGEQRDPVVVARAGGGFAAAFTSLGQDGSGEGVYLRAFDAAGNPLGSAEPVATTSTGNQLAPAIARLADGRLIVTWQSFGQDGSGYGIYARLFSGTGVAQGAEFRVNTAIALNQIDPVVAGLPDGGAVVVWASQSQDGSGYGIYAQRLDASGAAAGSEFRVNTVTAYDQQQPRVAVLQDGSFVVTWESRLQDGSGFGIYARTFDASGVASGAETLVNATTLGHQLSPAVAALSGGGYVLHWLTPGSNGVTGSIYGKIFDGAGGISGPLTVRGTAGSEVFNLAGSGGIQVRGLAGDDTYVVNEAADLVIEAPGQGYDRILSYITLVLPDNVEMLRLVGAAAIDGTGNALDNTLIGNSAANRLDGGGGADFLRGGAGDDVYVVSTGDVVSELPGEGRDLVYSDVGWTLADSVEDLVITTDAGVSAAGNSGANAMTGGAGNDVFRGQEGADTLIGGGGNDELRGGTGADLLQGGTGDDAYYVEAGDVVVELAAEGRDTVFSSSDWTLGAELEALWITGTAAVGAGNAADNELYGNEFANELYGLGGDDYLQGGGGTDILAGGAGNDTLYGASGADRFVFDTALSGTLNVDTISTLQRSIDRIVLDDDVFTAFNAGVSTTVTAAQFVSGPGVTEAADASDRLAYDTDTGNLYYDPDGAGGVASVLFATISPGAPPNLLVSNFVIAD